MGLLDELKAEAEALQSRQRRDEAAFERNALRTDEACKSVFHYWLDLGRQLNVLRPAVPVRYVFETQHVLDGPAESLRFEDFQVDARRNRVRNLELYDHVVISGWVRGHRRMTIGKELPAEAERLDARLAQAGVVVAGDVQRDAETGRFRETRYDFEADVRVGVRVLPEHGEGRLQFACSNLEGLGSMHVEFAAIDVDVALLDELSKWWLGRPNGFVAAGRVVKMYEP
jgi:hypothetical protein